MSKCIACGRPKHWPVKCHEIGKSNVTQIKPEPVRHVTEDCAGCASRDKRIAELEAQLGARKANDAERQRRRRAK